jgi:hypothetical protein
MAFITFRAFKYEIYFLFDFYPCYHLHFVVKGAGHMCTVSDTTLWLSGRNSLFLSLFSMVHFHWNTTGLVIEVNEMLKIVIHVFESDKCLLLYPNASLKVCHSVIKSATTILVFS